MKVRYLSGLALGADYGAGSGGGRDHQPAPDHKRPRMGPSPERQHGGYQQSSFGSSCGTIASQLIPLRVLGV